MACRHNYVYSQGYFFCTKCGQRRKGKSYKKNQRKKIGIGLSIALIAGIVAILFFNGIIEINQENLDETIQNFPQNLPQVPEDFPTIPIQVSEPIKDIVDTSVEEINKIEEKIKEQSLPEESSEEYALKSIDYINQKRAQYGKNPITHDSRVYDLAMARVKDMHEYEYHDHTNPFTGTCPYNMKSDFGLNSNENVAENSYLFGEIGNPTIYNPSYIEIIDGWMESTGHRMNLLSYEHVSGSVSCYGGYCVFLGLNHGNFGEGCYTASEGQEYASRFDNCSPEQMREYENLLQEYDRIPSTVNSQSDYQRAMRMYEQIENFRC
jgi:uncharacterized protein YkwD